MLRILFRWLTKPNPKVPFSAAGFLAATLTLGVVWVGAIAVTFGFELLPEGDRENMLYGLGVIAFVPAGLLAGRLAGSLAAREIVLATLTVTGATLLYGQFGITLNPLAPPPANPELDILRVMASAPGSAYLGMFWARNVVAIAGLGLLQALTASSLAFMFSSAGGFDVKTAFEAWVGSRYLAAKRRDARVSSTALIAALGVCFGVATLIAVVSTMSGYQQEVKEKLLNTNAHIIVQRIARDFEEHDKVAQELRTISGIVATTPFIFTGGMLAVEDPEEVRIEDDRAVPSGSGNFAVLVKGVDPDQVGAVTGIRQQTQDGDISALRPPKPGELPNVLVGAELFKKLGVKKGTILSLTSPVASEGKRGGTPKRMRFRLAGGFASGMNEFDQKLIYMGLEAAQQFIGTENGVTGIEVKTVDAERVSEFDEKIRLKLGGFPYRVLDYAQMNSGIFSALKMQKVMMILILVFIVIVAAFNIASTLFMLVVEKTREVAVLKAMGAKDGMIMKIFVIEGHLIGTLGVVSGVLLGLLFCVALGNLRLHIAADVYLVDTLRVVVNPLEVLLVVLGALEVAHLATLYPALRASRTTPVEAMRYG